jgi:3-phenylpropionate/cinnamic acid dioxygenase small subunit
MAANTGFEMSELEDKDAIRDLLSLYCVCMDNGRWREMAALFTADGDWNGTVGRAAIEAKVAAIVPTPEAGPRRIHFLSNVIIRVNGAEAEAHSNWLVVRASDGGPILGAAGTYRDDLVRQDGGWLIRRRRITHDIDGDLGLLPTR